jgi:outer membrane protein TolC
MGGKEMANEEPVKKTDNGMTITGLIKGPAAMALVVSIMLLLPFVARSEELTFPDALQRLKDTNESLRASLSELDQRNRERDIARGLYFPKILASGRYARINEPISIDLNDIRAVMLRLHPLVSSQMVPSFELQVQDDTFWKANITAQWTIFAGGQILAANRAADAFVLDAREKKRAAQSFLTSELARRYFGVQLAKSLTAMRKEEFAGLDGHLTRVKKLEEAGMAARVETLHAEVARAEAHRELRDAIKDEELAHTALENLLTCSKDSTPVTPLFIVRDIGPLDSFRALALERNPSLKQISAQKEAAHQAYRKEVGSLTPQVTLFGQRELRKDDLTILEPEWTCGVALNFTLFEGGARANRIRSARAVEEKVAHLEAQAKRDIETLVEKRYQEWAKAVEQYDTLGAALSSAEEYLRVRTRSFEEGYATSLDVVDARLALTRVKTGRVMAAYKVDCALAELLEASGMSERFEEYRNRADVEVKS